MVPQRPFAVKEIDDDDEMRVGFVPSVVVLLWSHRVERIPK